MGIYFRICRRSYLVRTQMVVLIKRSPTYMFQMKLLEDLFLFLEAAIWR